MDAVVKFGKRYKLIDPKNFWYGVIVTVSYIEDGQYVRFSDAPFPGFGAGLDSFAKNFQLIED